MEYPEEIYKTRAGHPMTEEQIKLSGWARERAYNLGYDTGYWNGYEAGMANPLAGYSNLTAAISAGEPIDYEKLDGLVAKCVHPTLGNLLYPLEVDGNGRKVIWNNEGNFWFTTNGGSVWAEALSAAWHGQEGWTLWVEGEVPLRSKTADQLDEGRCFLGKQGADFDPELMIVVGFTEDPKLNKIKPLGEHPGYLEPWQVEVLEEYGIGTFQKPEGK